jgi:hypothetical protein
MTEEEVAEYGSAKKYYVALDKLVATDARVDDAWALEEFIRNVRASGKFGVSKSTPIFGVKRRSKLLKDGKNGFVELMDHVFTRVKNYMSPAKTLSLSLYTTPFDDDCEGLLEHIARCQPLTSSPAQQFALALAEAKSVKESNWSEFLKVLNFCKARGEYTPGATVDFTGKWQEIKAQYPMLKFVSSPDACRQRKILVDYIRLVDESNQREALLSLQQQLLASAASNS